MPWGRAATARAFYPCPITQPPVPQLSSSSAAGIEEFVIEFLPGLVAQDGVEKLAGMLHLHATDGPAEWWIDLETHAPARPQHAEADTRSGPAGRTCCCG